MAGALDERWRETLETVARAARLPFGVEAAASVRALSDAYNSGRADGSLGARLAFFFARDVPKASAAVRELVLTGALRLPEGRPLRLLDLGAGLGAATWGVARALPGEIEATLVDRDAKALDLAKAIVRLRGGPRMETIIADVTKFSAGNFDLAIAENVLAELGAPLSPGGVEQDADRLQRWLSLLGEDGSLVIIEPALRTRTRHLHAVRDLCASRGVGIFAPCLHARLCPALAREGDWCHEDLPIDLPPWLVPVARAAGLRWEGLTFSYLVLRRDGRTLASAVPSGALRAISKLIITKGKREVSLCGATVTLEARRLDRDATPTNQPLDDIARGDLVVMEPLPTESGPVRVGREARVARVVPVDGGSGRS
jgi:ribosomal protein RSM22 (predicted rRNA methylase)